MDNCAPNFVFPESPKSTVKQTENMLTLLSLFNLTGTFYLQHWRMRRLMGP